MEEISVKFVVYLLGLLVGILYLEMVENSHKLCVPESPTHFLLGGVQPDEDTGEFAKRLPRQVENIRDVTDVTDNHTSSTHGGKILCWMMTYKTGLEKRGKHVVATWWKHCDIRVITSSEKDEKFDAVVLDGVIEGHGNLYTKTMSAYLYVWKHYKDKADWFMKVDDDAYVIMENLKEFLKDKNPNDPVWYGARLKTHVKQGYMSGGAGYILSKEATRRYVEGLASGKGLCDKRMGPEDVRIGQCLDQVGVLAGDDRDRDGSEMFHALQMDRYTSTSLIGNVPGFSVHYYPVGKGVENTSRQPISFHHVSPDRLYMFHYLFYKAEVAGSCTYDSSKVKQI